MGADVVELVVVQVLFAAVGLQTFVDVVGPVFVVVVGDPVWGVVTVTVSTRVW